MIKVRAEVKDDESIHIDFECEGNSYNVMQELICIISRAMTEMVPVEGATVEDLVRALPDAVIDSMRLNGVLDNAEK